MNRLISRSCWTLVTIAIGAVAAAVLAFAVKFGWEMGSYLETSTGLASVGVVAKTDTSPATASAPTGAAEPVGDAPVATATAPPRNEDAAELRTTTEIATH